jgi:hypothetical protein
VISGFRSNPDGLTCVSTTVTVGRTSVDAFEAKAGEQIISSNRSPVDAFDRVRLKQETR